MPLIAAKLLNPVAGATTSFVVEFEPDADMPGETTLEVVFPKHFHVASDAVSGLRNIMGELVVDGIKVDKVARTTTVTVKVRATEPPPVVDAAHKAEHTDGEPVKPAVILKPVTTLARKGERCAFNLNKVTNPKCSGVTKSFFIRAYAVERIVVDLTDDPEYQKQMAKFKKAKKAKEDERPIPPQEWQYTGNTLQLGEWSAKGADMQPGELLQAKVLPQNLVVSTPSEVHVTFKTSNPVPHDGYICVHFDEAFLKIEATSNTTIGRKNIRADLEVSVKEDGQTVIISAPKPAVGDKTSMCLGELEAATAGLEDALAAAGAIDLAPAEEGAEGEDAAPATASDPTTAKQDSADTPEAAAAAGTNDGVAAAEGSGNEKVAEAADGAVAGSEEDKEADGEGALPGESGADESTPDDPDSSDDEGDWKSKAAAVLCQKDVVVEIVLEAGIVNPKTPGVRAQGKRTNRTYKIWTVTSRGKVIDEELSVAASKFTTSVSQKQLLAFLFPKGQNHPRSTGRLFVLHEHGPLDEVGRLRGGKFGGHIVSETELRCMVEEIYRQDIVLVYKNSKEAQTLTEPEKEEIIRSATRDVKHAIYNNFSLPEVVDFLQDIPRNTVGGMDFKDLQDVIGNLRKQRISTCKHLSGSSGGQRKGKRRKGKGARRRGSGTSSQHSGMRPKRGTGRRLIGEGDKMHELEVNGIMHKMLHTEACRICDIRDANNPALTQNVILLRPDRPELNIDGGDWNKTCCMPAPEDTDNQKSHYPRTRLKLQNVRRLPQQKQRKTLYGDAVRNAAVLRAETKRREIRDCYQNRVLPKTRNDY